MLTSFNKSILAIIPARGGSKGIKSKNIILLNGQPLIVYTINAALNSKLITKTIVSSENDEILSVSQEFGAEIIKRPDIYASDDASSESVITNAIEQLNKKGETFDIILLLQPTSPLRDSNEIDKAIKMMLRKNARGVISVLNIGVKPFKAYFENKQGYLEGVHNNSSPNMRRQDLPDALLSNGAIYGIYTEDFLKSKKLITTKTIAYIMDEEKSHDIDSMEDLITVENILKKKSK